MGQLLSESARFSIWFGSDAKKKATSPKHLGMLSLTTIRQLQHVYDAWTSYISAYEASGGKVEAFAVEEDSLRRALREAISSISEARRSFEGGGQ
ncbi:hypothetical protein [Streptomyces sp. NPDC058847]|uniref:hypothetical protein n=1 Tax=Streptomyces sp. NPDC058847 TaxID=3346649 RepID=UPI003679AE1C